MDIKVKFIIWFAILASTVILYSIFIYISGTRDPLSGSNVPFDPIAIDDSKITDILNANVVNRTQKNINEDRVIATIELSDPTNTVSETTSIDNITTKSNEIVYKVIFHGRWSKQLHHPFYTKGAHMSPVVVLSHKIQDVLFKNGGFATKGLQIVTETENVDAISEELKALGNDGQILDFTIGTKIDVPGIDEVNIIVSEEKPKVTAISMIAPSPDWFVAVQNINLFENGEWVDIKHVETTLYDAGTDNGLTFNSRNSPTTPKETIHKFDDIEISLPLAYFEFIKL